jgi:HAMP domain-containing protein
MARSGENVEGAVALEFEAAEQVDAAQSEQSRGAPSISLGLLRDAIEKERDSLDLLEQGVETLRQSLEQRRRSLEQQQEILSALANCLAKERS